MFLISRLLSLPLYRRYGVRKAAAAFLSDRCYATLAFRKDHGHFPSRPPVTFNERIAALIATGRLDYFAPYCDKLAVRDYVARKVGAEHLVPLYAAADRLTPELWERLPDSFMLKPNHGSSWTRLVLDKRTEDFDALAALTDGWLRMNYYYLYRESQYRPIKPVLLFEKVLVQGGDDAAASSGGEAVGQDLVDYKIFCFHGRARLVHVLLHYPVKRRLLYDLDWNKLDVRYKRPNDGHIPRPARLEDMLAIAESLAVGFEFVRVDLFSVPEGVFFGELTLTPLVGSDKFDPPDFDRYLGELWAGTGDTGLGAMARWRAPAAATGI